MLCQNLGLLIGGLQCNTITYEVVLESNASNNLTAKYRELDVLRSDVVLLQFNDVQVDYSEDSG